MTLALHRAYKRGIDVPSTLLKQDIAGVTGLDRRNQQRRRLKERRRRYEDIIDGMFTGVLPRRK
jgi:hypothetical protein